MLFLLVSLCPGTIAQPRETASFIRLATPAKPVAFSLGFTPKPGCTPRQESPVCSASLHARATLAFSLPASTNYSLRFPICQNKKESQVSRSPHRADTRPTARPGQVAHLPDCFFTGPVQHFCFLDWWASLALLHRPADQPAFFLFLPFFFL